MVTAMFKDNDKAIYLQIADRICDDILAGRQADESRLPSVRDYAASVEVNANTVMRSYDYLASIDVIYNKRGIGYFVSPGAGATVARRRRDELFRGRLNDVFADLHLLGIDPDTLKSEYVKYLESAK